MEKLIIGRPSIKPFFCPVCKGITGEQQRGRDRLCPLGMVKVATLCYKCGFTETTLKNKWAR